MCAKEGLRLGLRQSAHPHRPDHSLLRLQLVSSRDILALEFRQVLHRVRASFRFLVQFRVGLVQLVLQATDLGFQVCCRLLESAVGLLLLVQLHARLCDLFLCGRQLQTCCTAGSVTGLSGRQCFSSCQ